MTGANDNRSFKRRHLRAARVSFYRIVADDIEFQFGDRATE